MARETRSGKNSLGTNSSNQTSEHIMEGSSFTQPNPSSGNMRENNGVKKKRGPTAMHKIWVREENTVISLEYNKFGQPIGENKSALHFLGTISRNGKYAPINYGSWTKAPEHFKTNMIQLVKRQFDVPPGKESWIMMSLGKKWRNWKARIKWIHFKAFLPFDTQVRKVPQRLHLDQWSGLLKSWYSDNMQKKELGHSPTRKQLFLFCYVKKNAQGTKSASEASKEAIEKMEKLLEQALEDFDDKISKIDIFSQVMGQEKHGHMRMYGLGVCPFDVYSEIPSRFAFYRMAIEFKSNLDTVQSIVSFKSIMNSSEIVAKGVVNNMDPTTKVGGVDLGLNWCEVNVQVPIKWDE